MSYALERNGRRRVHVERRLVVAVQRLVAEQAVPRDFGLGGERGAVDPRERAQDVVVLVQVPGIEAVVRAPRVGARLGLLVLHRVADVHLAVVVQREVDARDPLIVVLRVTAAGIDRQRFLDASEHRRVGGQRLKGAGTRWRS